MKKLFGRSVLLAAAALLLGNSAMAQTDACTTGTLTLPINVTVDFTSTTLWTTSPIFTAYSRTGPDAYLQYDVTGARTVQHIQDPPAGTRSFVTSTFNCDLSGASQGFFGFGFSSPTTLGAASAARDLATTGDWSIVWGPRSAADRTVPGFVLQATDVTTAQPANTCGTAVTIPAFVNPTPFSNTQNTTSMFSAPWGTDGQFDLSGHPAWDVTGTGVIVPGAYALYQFTPGASGTFTFTSSLVSPTADSDTVIYILTGACASLPAALDDASAENLSLTDNLGAGGETVNQALTGGTTYTIIHAGWSPFRSYGNLTLQVSGGPSNVSDWATY